MAQDSPGAEDRRMHSPPVFIQMSRRTVLVVAAEAPVRGSVTAALGRLSYEVLTADAFVEGRRLLVDRQPDVLVTSVRLREHNGIHLAIVSRIASALTKTIVIGYGDPVLQGEARQVGAVYLIDPTADEIAAAVETAVHRRERRWPRARANISALAANQAVRLVDLSYGGFRIELAPGSALPADAGFDLTVGGVRVTALPVWMKAQSAGESIWCGATVDGHEDRNMAWRNLVDGALGRDQPVA